MKSKTIKIAALAAAALIASTASAQAPSPWRDADPENTLVIETNKGRIIAELTPQIAPQHVERIKTLTRQGFYDGRSFFRVIDGFMDQTGDPQDSGDGGSTLPDLQPEFSFRRGQGFPYLPIENRRPNTGLVGVTPVQTQPDAQMAITADGKVSGMGLFCRGVLGMARAQDPASANSQFFLMRDDNEPLNGKYTVFGRVLSGLDVVRSIKTGEPVPPPQDKMTRVRLLADIPPAERPTVRVLSTSSAEFTGVVQQQKKAKGSAFDICDLDIPVSVQ
jgi:peptidylprolyl isomerase